MFSRSPIALRQQSRKKTPPGKATKSKTVAAGSSATKKRPEWSPYLTEDNKFALSKDELLRRKLSLISRHNLFNGELACVDTGVADYPKTPPLKATRSATAKKSVGKKTRNDRDTLDLVSNAGRIEASLEENERLELELDLGDSDDDDDDDDDDADEEDEDADDDDVLSRWVPSSVVCCLRVCLVLTYVFASPTAG